MNRFAHAIVLPAGPRLLRLLAAALDGSGPAICPLSPDLPAPALRSIIGALAPAAIETADGIRPYRPAAEPVPKPGTEPSTEAGTEPVPKPHTEPSTERATEPVPVEDGTAVLIATSGSTGSPKIVELSAAALTHSATATLRRIEAGPGERWLCCLPAGHVAGLQVLVRSLVGGTEPVIHERFDVAATAASGAAHISVVPTQLRRLMDAGADLSAFRTVLLGGAAAPADLLATARSRGGRIVTTYGMSETCGGCVYDGLPLNDVEVGLTGDGRIAIAGPTLFTGYRLRPDLTASVREGRRFVTGDLGSLDDGLLRVRGRIDDIINTGGEKVVAAEVERVLTEHPDVLDAVIVGRPDAEWGELVTAIVVAAAPVTLDQLRAHVRRRLPGHAAPRALELVAAIPLLPSGKPDRQRLRTP
jgi:o-succinylbenzoate---CoA ligase